jgi:hypothetical protein
LGCATLMLASFKQRKLLWWVVPKADAYVIVCIGPAARLFLCLGTRHVSTRSSPQDVCLTEPTAVAVATRGVSRVVPATAVAAMPGSCQQGPRA